MTPPQRLRARNGLTVIELDGEGVVYDADSGNLHHLNHTAWLVFSLCDGTGTARELSADIADAFEMDATEVEHQVRSLLRTMKREELVETVRG